MSKMSIKAKSRTEVREALTKGTLFTNVVLNDREVTFTLAPEFEAQCHHRVINQVLKSLRNSSSLKQDIYDIKNVNRYPTLTLTKKHHFTDGKAVLNALIAAQTPSNDLQPTAQNTPSQSQDDNTFWDFIDDLSDIDMDLNSVSSHAYTSRSSSSEDFFESLFQVNPTVFGYMPALDRSTAYALEASIKLGLEKTEAAEEPSKENIDLGYRF